ncbi:MAG: hypothetical protein ACYDFU_10590 [Nitrospirota bacterium]
MKNFLKFALLVISLELFINPSWGLPQKTCPARKQQLNEAGFMKAHGIASMKDYSIWLKEHSVWRRKYNNELENFSFIPKRSQPERRP